ncbi:MAG: ARMT1-like domain-containing protein [Candidatus Bathyarchaeota archaeon]|nr:ARMT1-like domain-containing protein [Candidatus Bathyarchaeota archaeon]
MKSRLLCIPCTLRAAYDIATKATDDEEIHKRVIYETLNWLSNSGDLLNISPTSLHTQAFKLVQKITGNNDPFANLKRESNKIAMRLTLLLENEIEKKPFYDAFRLAILGATCGNSIDFEVEDYQFSIEKLEKSLMECIRSGLVLDDTHKLMDIFSKSSSILYLLDNAGEIAFDKIFIKVITKTYPVKVFAAVKSGPIMNDATLYDALQVGLNEVAEVITTGSSSIGLNLDECSEEFMEYLKKADVIIAKGQGYYESLTEIEHILSKPIAYILRAKCSVVAKSLNVNRGANIVKVVNY